jgi:hypothetical protein
MEVMAVTIMEIVAGVVVVVVGAEMESRYVYLTPLAVWLIEYILICMAKKRCRNRCLHCNKRGHSTKDCIYLIRVAALVSV